MGLQRAGIVVETMPCPYWKSSMCLITAPSSKSIDDPNEMD